MQRSSKLLTILTFCIFMFVGSTLALSQSAPTMEPVVSTMAPVPVMRPAPRPVAMKPVPLVMAAPAAMPAPAMTPAMEVPKPAVMSAALAAAMDQPTMAAVPDKPAVAPSPKKDSKGSVIGGWLLETFLYLLGILLIAVKGVLIRWLWTRYKLDKYVSADKMDEIADKGVKMGIGYAEEQAHKLHDDPIDSAKKLDLAIGKANEYLRDSGLPEKGAKYLAALIESKLPETRVVQPKPEPESAEEVKKEEEPVEKSDR